MMMMMMMMMTMMMPRMMMMRIMMRINTSTIMISGWDDVRIHYKAGSHGMMRIKPGVLDGQRDGWTGGWMDTWTDGRVDGRTGERFQLYFFIFPSQLLFSSAGFWTHGGPLAGLLLLLLEAEHNLLLAL